MDFSIFANDRYVRLVRHFDSIAHVLHIHLLELERIGFNLKEGYMFGFSYGGRLVCEAARRLGVRKIKDIDGWYALNFVFEVIGNVKIFFPKKKFVIWLVLRSIFDRKMISNYQHRMFNAYIRIVVTKALVICPLVIKTGGLETVDLHKVSSATLMSY